MNENVQPRWFVEHVRCTWLRAALSLEDDPKSWWEKATTVATVRETADKLRGFFTIEAPYKSGKLSLSGYAGEGGLVVLAARPRPRHRRQ